MPSSYSIAAGAAVAVYAFLQWLLKYTQDPREPPPLGTLIPFISPIIGMMRKKTKYYIQLRDQSNLPICTLRMPGSRIYIVNSPTLIAAAQRQHKTLSFWPIMMDASIKVTGFSNTTKEIFASESAGGEGSKGYAMTFDDYTHPPLAPGMQLDAMNRVMLGLVAGVLKRVGEQMVTKVSLFEWVKEQITMITTSAAYGPTNPYKDPEIKAAFWTLTKGISNMTLGLPATASAQAMTFGAVAFEKYFARLDHEKGAALIQARYRHSMDHHIPLNDIARAEFANGIALLSNTIPNTFWMLYHIYSDPTVLAEIRKELAGVVSMTDGNTRTLDVSKVKTSCPILLSAWKEVLRLHSAAVTVRQVTQDHMLNGEFLLKEGNTVLMPSPVQHHNAAIWGPDHNTFNHRRFANSNTGSRTTQAGFRAFGGGTTLCPGRHFATTEILAFTAIMLLQFDVTPVSGSWNNGLASVADIWESTSRPAEDFEVEIRAIESSASGRDWAFVLSDSDEPIALSAEDIAVDAQ